MSVASLAVELPTVAVIECSTRSVDRDGGSGLVAVELTCLLMVEAVDPSTETASLPTVVVVDLSTVADVDPSTQRQRQWPRLQSSCRGCRQWWRWIR